MSSSQRSSSVASSSGALARGWWVIAGIAALLVATNPSVDDHDDALRSEVRRSCDTRSIEFGGLRVPDRVSTVLGEAGRGQDGRGRCWRSSRG